MNSSGVGSGKRSKKENEEKKRKLREGVKN
jgi:hypothetical protein